MSNMVKFNIVEVNKTNNAKDIEKAINIIIDKLIKQRFMNLQ